MERRAPRQRRLRAMARRLAVIGAGKMGSTLLRALLDSGAVDASEVAVTVRHAAGEVVLVGVKPQALGEVLAELAPALGPDQLVVSIVASATTAYIEQRLQGAVPVVRAMPNTPALIGAGMTVLCAGRHASPEHLGRAEDLFRAVGRTRVLDEKHLDAVTALSASGPAFIYVVLESLAEGGVKVGLPRHVATELAAQMCLGAAKMVLETGEHPAMLKDAVTTPAGCTIDGLLELEAGGLRVTLIKAVVEATRRAGQLVAG
jgi:pyrroline-5-carboxylate reductase